MLLVNHSVISSMYALKYLSLNFPDVYSLELEWKELEGDLVVSAALGRMEKSPFYRQCSFDC